MLSPHGIQSARTYIAAALRLSPFSMRFADFSAISFLYPGRRGKVTNAPELWEREASRLSVQTQDCTIKPHDGIEHREQYTTSSARQ